MHMQTMYTFTHMREIKKIKSNIAWEDAFEIGMRFLICF